MQTKRIITEVTCRDGSSVRNVIKEENYLAETAVQEQNINMHQITEQVMLSLAWNLIEIYQFHGYICTEARGVLINCVTCW